MDAKVDVVGREVIKPASAAPHDRLQLSLVDVASPAGYFPTIFFYKAAPGESPEIISRRLKCSLSETLTRFYPLAGRIDDGVSISCNDEGAVFTEARTDLLLSDFLKNNLNDTDSLKEFPVVPGESAGTWPLVSVMVSFFGYGSGAAVTMSISHKICNASSLCTFVQAWADTTKGDVALTTPKFAETTIYPPPRTSFQTPELDDLFELRGKTVTNRFVFKSSKIAELKRKAASESVPVPTRVEAISSLLWICASNASRSNSVAPKSTMMSQAMDLRLRIPSNVLQQDAIGNLQSSIFLKKGAEVPMEISEIVAEFRKGKEWANEMIEENTKGHRNGSTKLGEYLLSVMGALGAELKPDIDLYAISSWCKKPFYEVDFGWGTPVWMGFALYAVSNNLVYVFLMDSKDSEDVEAWVGLPKQDMSVLVRDLDLLTYAIINPPVLI